MSNEELIENHTIFFAYFCHLIENKMTDFIEEELCDIGMKLDNEIVRRKISNTEIDEFIRNANLCPEDQLMVATYIFPESDLFNVKTGQS